MPREQKGARVRRTSLGALEVATYGILASLALIFGYIEALFPLPVPVPGVKLGLGNIVVLYALVALGPRSAVAVMLVKVVASALLFGNASLFVYSAAGAALSLALMAASSHIRGMSLMGISMVGGVGHVLGQLVVVAAVLSPAIALTYLPVLVVSGLATGAVVAVLCRLVLQATRNSAVLRQRRRAMALAARARLEAGDGGGAVD